MGSDVVFIVFDAETAPTNTAAVCGVRCAGCGVRCAGSGERSGLMFAQTANQICA